MLDERARELINGAADGELTAEEQRKLEAILAESPEAAAFSAELARLVRQLEALPPLEPPEQLTQRILRRVELPARGSRFAWQSVWPQARPVGFGLAFAAGLLAAVAVYELVPAPSSQLDWSTLVGTLARDKPGDDGGRIDSLAIDVAAVRGTVLLSTARNAGNLMILRFDLESPGPLEVDVGLAGSGLAVSGFVQSGGGPGMGLETLAASADAVRVVNAGGQRFALFLKPRPNWSGQAEDIRIEVLQEGELKYQGFLSARL